MLEIGKKAGEKLYEELMSEEETTRAVELKDHFVIMPAFKGVYQNLSSEHEDAGKPVTDPYISTTQKYMTVDEIKQYLKDNRLIG